MSVIRDGPDDSINKRLFSGLQHSHLLYRCPSNQLSNRVVKRNIRCSTEDKPLSLALRMAGMDIADADDYRVLRLEA
jgi:hypothetical protein